jgi:8-oxo-dGTP pyrophosphatase MutT (NUDIX family)
MMPAYVNISCCSFSFARTGPTMLTFDDIHTVLSAYRLPVLPSEGATRAAVAMVLRSAAADLEVLFIERALHDSDPWSGDVGFPGGKVEPLDTDERSAAERETGEELGLDLSAARFLGRLADIAGAHVPVRVSCFVYGIAEPLPCSPGDEVRSLFWIPLSYLQDPERHGDLPVRFGGDALIRPAIRLLEPGRPVLWGITYRLVMQFLQLITTSGLYPVPDSTPNR